LGLKASKNTLGYTLVELLVSLIIFSCLSALVLPSYSSYKSRRAVALKAWEIKRSLELGRSVAVTQNRQIKVCTATAQGRCVRRFGRRLLVFQDQDGNHQWTEGESLYRDTELGKFDIKLSASRRAYIRFKGSGESLESGNFLVCFADTEDFGRQVIVFRSGRIRLSKDSNRDGYDDKSGQQIICDKPS